MNLLLQSSQDPSKLAMTIQGLLVGIVPLIIAVFQVAGIEAAQAQVVEIIQGVSVVIALVFTAVGVVRKAVNAIKDLVKTIKNK